ncbi:MAG: recombinase family protein [Candidatus Bathyarchaeia archaeon]
MGEARKVRRILSGVERLRSYCSAKGYRVVEVVTDVASGLNEKRGDLQRLLDMAIKHKIDVVVVKSRDRSTRFGFEYLAEVHKDKKDCGRGVGNG